MASSFPRRTASVLAVLALTFSIPAGLHGQDAPPISRPTRPTQDPAPHPDGPQLVTLDFGGGNLASYVDLLREKFDLNAVVAPDTSDFPMPPLSLKKVSVGTAMNLIEAMSRSLSGDAGAVSVNTISDPEGNPVFIVDLKSQNPPNMMGPVSMQGGMPGSRTVPNRTVRIGSQQAAPLIPQPVRTLQVFSIKLLTQPVPGRNDLAMPADNVLTAIDTALGLSAGDEPAEIKYHPETGLLFVHGTPGQLEAVGTLIRTLNDDQMTLRKTAPPAEDLQKVVDRLQAENENLRARIASVISELNELKRGVPAASPRGTPGGPQPTPRSEPSKN